MKPRKRASNKPRKAKTSELEREEEYRAVIEPDPLLKEVGEANERIGFHAVLSPESWILIILRGSRLMRPDAPGLPNAHLPEPAPR